MGHKYAWHSSTQIWNRSTSLETLLIPVDILACHKPSDRRRDEFEVAASAMTDLSPTHMVAKHYLTAAAEFRSNKEPCTTEVHADVVLRELVTRKNLLQRLRAHNILQYTVIYPKIT